jgi:hypothetical protein
LSNINGDITLITKSGEKMSKKRRSSIVNIIIILFLFLVPFSLAQNYSQSGGTVTKTGQTYTSTVSDISGVCVSNNGTLTLLNSSIKTSGNTTSTDSSSFYGLNAGVLANSSSTINLSGCNISTSGTGANGVFASGQGSSIVLTNDTITCANQLGHGVDATNGATLTLTNVLIHTAGGSSAAIATDRGGGTINVTGGTFSTTGTTAPGIYSTGAITVSGAAISATGSEGAVIEGANSINLTNTILSGSVKRGIMIYQSMSGDAKGTQGTFTMTGGSFTAYSGPLFYVTNSTGIIKISGVTTAVTSGVLIDAAADTWGTPGSNGGTVKFTADNETILGNITCDNISSIAVTLQNSTTLTSAIDSAAVSIDATSKWIVTGKSYIASLTDESGISGNAITNITGNGNNVYYNPGLSGNSYLGNKTYTLVNGGYLLPDGTTTGINDINSSAPTTFGLNQNYPNPFNPSTVITYSIPKSGFVTIKVYDILGNEIATLVNEEKSAGNYSVQFFGGKLSAGIYFYRMQSGNYSQTRKLILQK